MKNKSRPETLKQLILLADHDACFHAMLRRGAIPQMTSLLLGEDAHPINQQIFIKPPGYLSKATPLTCAVSQDGGATWGTPKDLEDDPGIEFTNVA